MHTHPNLILKILFPAPCREAWLLPVRAQADDGL